MGAHLNITYQATVNTIVIFKYLSLAEKLTGHHSNIYANLYLGRLSLHIPPTSLSSRHSKGEALCVVRKRFIWYGIVKLSCRYAKTLQSIVWPVCTLCNVVLFCLMILRLLNASWFVEHQMLGETIGNIHECPEFSKFPMHLWGILA